MAFSNQETDLWKKIQRLKNLPRTVDIDGLYEILYGTTHYPELYNQLRVALQNHKHWIAVTLLREGFNLDGHLVITPPRLWENPNYKMKEKDVTDAKMLQEYLEESNIQSETFGVIIKEMNKKGLKCKLSSYMLEYKMSIAHAAIHNAGYYIKRRGAKNGRQTFWITKKGEVADNMFHKMVQNDSSEFFLSNKANRPHQKLAREYWS